MLPFVVTPAGGLGIELAMTGNGTGVQKSTEASDSLRRRMIDVCLLMESDLSYPHTTKTLAEYAGVSQYYFRHGFKKVVGETAIAHLTRLRMAKAALALKNSDASITEIGIEIGYGANSSFTHAFQRIYGCSPSEYRRQQTHQPYWILLQGTRVSVDAEALAACPLTLQIRTEPTRRIALMRHVGSMKSMPLVWPKMLDWCRGHSLLNETATLFGIHRDDWNEADPDGFDRYRYDAAIAIAPNLEVDDQANATYLPGGEVAVVRFEGSLKQLDTTWDTFVNQWLPASGYQPRQGYAYDIYNTDLMMGSKLSLVLKTLKGIRCELCIPISRKPIAISKPE
ncbi:MAG: GyrI-like domain-containing protein [Planctomycetota bacterium]